MLSKSIKKAVKALSELPGIGEKTAERLVFFLLKQPEKKLEELSEVIGKLKENIRYCSYCCNYSEIDPCSICGDSSRDYSKICVVAKPFDIEVIEKTGEYKGIYFVLGGVLNPLENITPQDINIKELTGRLNRGKKVIKEIIIATSLDMEGETTALYLAKILKPLGLKITRLATGLPAGGELEYADEITLGNAIRGRHKI